MLKIVSYWGNTIQNLNVVTHTIVVWLSKTTTKGLKYQKVCWKKLELLQFTRVDIHWFSCCGKKIWHLLKKLNQEINI